MNIFTWADARIKNLHWYHVSLIKLSAAAFALMLAKLWPPLLDVAWSVYLAVAFLAAIPVCAKMMRG